MRLRTILCVRYGGIKKPESMTFHASGRIHAKVASVDSIVVGFENLRFCRDTHTRIGFGFTFNVASLLVCIKTKRHDNKPCIQC